MFRHRSHSSRKALDVADAQGFPFPTRPQELAASLPRDLTDLSDRELMELYSVFVSWCDYTGVQVALASADEKQALNTVSMLEAQVLIHNSANNKVTTARLLTKVDDDLNAAKEKAIENEAYRRLSEALLAAYERDAQLISRELTRRIAPRRDTT